MPLSAGTRLGPYEILSSLGAGGMGEVYRARDRKLDRDVAVKVLPQSVAADSDTLARFEREAKAVAALSHPNILSIFDFGTQDGVAYAVMELLEGESLRGRLAGGPIPQKQAVDYALQVAKGLSAAHEKGVVHRDLKPENLFVSKDGHLKILDFGLAKRVPQVPPGEATTVPTVSLHTEPGTVMGTAGYMSPEQVRGHAVDHRSDIFSFGTILYEMLSGKRAFKGDTAMETMTAILRDEPPELSGSGRSVPPALEHIVRHCLEKSPEQRFHSAHDVVFALEETAAGAVTSGPQAASPTVEKNVLVAVAVVMVLVLGIAGVFLLRRPHKATTEGVTRVAVLPFENLGSPEDDYFADGIADAVRGKLTSVRGLEVIARASSVVYKKTTKTPKQIANELQAPYLLTATLRWQKSGSTSRVQVTPELVEVKESGAPASKWQQPFDAALTDVFQVQSDIASRVAEALGVALGAGEEKRLSEKPTQNLVAYDAFLKGEEASKSMAVDEPPRVRKALSLYEQAVALDPDFALAWARVSQASSFLFWNTTPAPELAERARQAAERAVVLAPDRPEGYRALGVYRDYVLNDAVGAQEQYGRALRIGPISADLVAMRAFLETRLGHWDPSVELYRQAEHLDPLSVGTKTRLGFALLYMKRVREAREAFDRGLALAPAGLTLIESKAETFLVEGDLARARAVVMAAPKEVEPTVLVAFLANVDDLVWLLDEQQMELLFRLTPSAFDDERAAWALCLAQAYALKGDAGKLHTYAEEARTAFQKQLAATPQNPMRHALLGLTLAYLGQKEEAIREGERAVALQPVEKDAFFGPYNQHQLVRIFTLVREPEKALDQLEPLLKTPYVLSPGWLKIDPNFDPLRKNPRFQKLVANAK